MVSLPYVLYDNFQVKKGVNGCEEWERCEEEGGDELL
jgi:hypothetical protein